VNTPLLINTARMMVANGKGLLAMDESNPTCNKRFAQWGIPQNEETRRAYRELIVTTPGLGQSISGAILYDETIRQKKKDGTLIVKSLIDAQIIPGIKVDTGAKDMAGHAGEKVTEGLDGLRDRLAEYFQMGARFAKWRAVIALGDGIPSRGCIEANANALARLMSGSRTGSGDRTGSAHGRSTHHGALLRSNGGSPAHGFQRALLPTRDAGGINPEAQHGASGIDLR
jgi:fructose-bisphosphate aldolase class I